MREQSSAVLGFRARLFPAFDAAGSLRTDREIESGRSAQLTFAKLSWSSQRNSVDEERFVMRTVPFSAATGDTAL